MTQLPSDKPALFKGRHFNHLLIIQAVRWHVTYNLSYRDVCELMAERGVTVVHTTILRGVQCFVPIFEKKWKKYARPVGSSWRVDETYITLDGSQASHQAVAELKAEGVLPAQTLVRTNKYLVRGESDEGGWDALAELARQMARGVCAVITADGGGPARVARVGTAALASATGAPLLPVGADCRPAIYERHKWDRARTPLPFSHLAIALGRLRDSPVLADLASIEEARRRLQDALNEVAATAQRAIGVKAND